MKRVYQTRFGNDVSAPGNCFVACIASILEVKIEELPDEAEIASKLTNTEGWPDRVKRNKTWESLWRELQLYLLRRGLFMLEVTDSIFQIDSNDPIAFPQKLSWHIMSGKSPRGPFLHSCVGKGGKLVHDPHPDNAGLDLICSENKVEYTFFASINPGFGKVGTCFKHIPIGFMPCTREEHHDGPCAHELI